MILCYRSICGFPVNTICKRLNLESLCQSSVHTALACAVAGQTDDPISAPEGLRRDLRVPGRGRYNTFSRNRFLDRDTVHIALPGNITTACLQSKR